jgi:endonuclease/exonuclease/phosphatase family metal-dependent hydrolase
MEVVTTNPGSGELAACTWAYRYVCDTLTVDSEADLVGHLADVIHTVRQEVVLLQEVKSAEG